MAKNLGEFEILVMAALIQLNDEAYGISIRKNIEEKTGRSTSIGALYATLNRLEKKQLVSTKIGEATAVRGGRAKKYFLVTPLGRERFNHAIINLKKMLDGIEVWRAATHT